MKLISTSPMPDARIDELTSLAHDASPELQDVLTSLAASLREGDDVVAFEVDETLTPNQAAQRLGMSRTHLYKLLDDGTIASHRVGRDRRIAARDLLTFSAQRDADRRELAERFASQGRTRAGAIGDVADLL